MTRADDTANERPLGRDARANPDGSSDPGAAVEAPGIGYIGKRLGRFRIISELGRGGMATVYRAHDPHVGREVAVKVMHGFFAGRADIEARFRREANAVAAIRHPSILALYDFTPPAGEEPGYIVSEIIEGPGLRALAESRGGRLLPEVATSIAIRIAEALGAAHAAGIVHRDVKPDNVLIDTAGGGVRVVLTDFGVAHVGSLDTMTATGAVLGSPAFMSPEQARGDEVGPASDVFSLGVLLYQLLTGHLPFSGKDALALISALLRGEYIRPGKLEARIAPDLEQLVVRCLARESGGRLPDGRAVAAALRATLAAAGFTDEEALLRRALPDLDAFERAIAPEVAERAVQAAEAARKRGQIARALAEVGRALAYAPEHAVARALLERLGSRRRSPLLIAGVGLTAAAAVAIAAGALRKSPDGPPAASRPVAGTPEASKPPAAPPDAPTTAAPVAPALAPPAVVAENTSLAARTAAPSAPRARTRPPRTSGARPAAASQLAAPAAPAPPEPAKAAEPEQGPKPSTHDPASPAVAPPTPATSSVVVRASQGFCEPSLDAFPAAVVARHTNLTPGEHVIYCTLPQGGGKVRVATYQLRPGTRPSLIILRGPDGRPVLGRPE